MKEKCWFACVCKTVKKWENIEFLFKIYDKTTENHCKHNNLSIV